MTKSLLEKAREVPADNRTRILIEKEQIDLALAWMRGEITTKQANVAIGAKTPNGNILYMFAAALRVAYRHGRLIIKK